MKVFYKAHDECLRKLHREHQGNLWYLEIIGVHPFLQGRGVGKAVMEAVLRCAGGEPVVLECTQEANVNFYKRFGFEVYSESELVDPLSADPNASGSRVKLWVMVCQQRRDDRSSADRE
jgi:ribosomal protein S18 acetylase RimI-like enzyme